MAVYSFTVLLSVLKFWGPIAYFHLLACRQTKEPYSDKEQQLKHSTDTWKFKAADWATLIKKKL